jgi:hypothetical protein
MHLSSNQRKIAQDATIAQNGTVRLLETGHLLFPKYDIAAFTPLLPLPW